MLENQGAYEKLIPNVDLGLIEVLEELQSQKMLSVMKPYHIFTEVPDELNYILVELTIYRYNIVGSEGLKKEDKLGVDEYDTSYEERLLNKCEDYAQGISDTINNNWKIQFL